MSTPDATNEETIYDGPRFGVHRAEFGDRKREWVSAPDAVAVVAYDEKRLYLIRQDREAIGRGDILELPAGIMDVERLFRGYRHADDAPQVRAAEAALQARGYRTTRITTGGGSDANAFEAAGFPCTNLANGTERNHEPTERVSVAALEGMLDVTFALLEETAAP